jgi:electron-transferring-flavoprotein dehydrogenase
VCVIEKGSEVGSHVISGNVLQPSALDELLPGWREKRGPGEEFEGLPLRVEAKRDRFWLLTRGGGVRLPTPRQMRNKGNYVISLRRAAAAGFVCFGLCVCVWGLLSAKW